jgi:hypothetical protein
MAITLDGTNGITTPDVDSDGLTVDTNTLFVDAANNRVGVGTTAPSTKLTIQDNGVFYRAQNTVGGFATFGCTDSTESLGQINCTNALLFQVGSTECARIASDGSFLVNTTALANFFNGGSNAFGFDKTNDDRCISSRNTTSSSFHFVFYNPNGTVGSISSSGSATAYNTSSDYRLKEDVQPMVGSVDRLMALKPVNFAWKVDGSRVDGFLAHEAQEVVPECVTGEKDAVDDEGNPQYQGIDQSKIVPLLVAALQEALTKIEALEARVAALETNA